MSQEICDAVFTSPALSSAGYAKLKSFTSQNFSSLWDTLKQFVGQLDWPEILAVVEGVLAVLPIGAPWSQLIAAVLKALQDRLSKKQTALAALAP